MPDFEVSCEVRLATLATHYTNTYDIHLIRHKMRDKLFFYLLVCFSLFLVNFENSSLIQELLKLPLTKDNAAIHDKLVPYSSAILWVLLTFFTVHYFQICLLIEKDYNYLHDLELELNSFYPSGSVAFTREGHAYLKNYPMFSNWMCFSYTVLFPGLIILSALLRLPMDLQAFGLSYPGITCFFSYLIIAISTFSYLCKMHSLLGSKESHWKTVISIQVVVFTLLATLTCQLNISNSILNFLFSSRLLLLLLLFLFILLFKRAKEEV